MNPNRTDEELLMQQVEELLGRIEIGQDILEGLGKDAAILDHERLAGLAEERKGLERQVEANKATDARPLDAYLDGSVPVDSYREKAQLLADERRALELRLHEVADPSMSTGRW